MEKHVFFVRHGESEYNVDHIYRGGKELLTETGRAQAELVADRVARLGVTQLLASPMQRAVDTAQAISKRTNLEVEIHDVLHEWGEPTAFLGKSGSDPEILAAATAMLTSEDPDYRHFDEETFTEMKARAEQVLALLEAQSAERICVVTHFGFLQMLTAKVLFGERLAPWITNNMFYLLRHRNTGVTYLKHGPSTRGRVEWQVVTWNDQSHFG